MVFYFRFCALPVNFIYSALGFKHCLFAKASLELFLFICGREVKFAFLLCRWGMNIVFLLDNPYLSVPELEGPVSRLGADVFTK